MQVAPDGTTGAVEGVGGFVLFNAADGGDARWYPILERGGAVVLCFSPDGKTLAVGESDIGTPDSSPIQFRAVADGSLISYLTPPGQGGFLHQLAVSPDGQAIASCTSHGSLLLRKAADGQPYFSLGLQVVNASSGVAFSPDSKLCAGCVYTVRSGYLTSDLFVLRSADGSTLYDIQFPIGYLIDRVRFSPDGQYFVVPWGSGNYAVYKVSDGSLAFTLPFLGYDFEFSPDGKYIAAAGTGGISLYDWPTGNLVKTGNVSVGRLTWSPDSQSFVGLTSGTSDAVRLSVPSLNVQWRASILAGGTDTAHFSPDGQVIAVTGQDSASLQLYSASDGTPLTVYTDETYFNSGYWGGVQSAAYSADGKFLYYGRGDGTLCCALNPYRNLILPAKGGNTGLVTVKIVNPDNYLFAEGTSITLHDNLHPDIVGQVTKIVNSKVLETRFELNGAPLGPRDIVINSPGSGVRNFPMGFTVEVGTPPQLVTSWIGPTTVRGHSSHSFGLMVENMGNTDAYAADMRVEFPGYMQFSVKDPEFVAIDHDSRYTVLTKSKPLIPALESKELLFTASNIVSESGFSIPMLGWVNQGSEKVTLYGLAPDPLLSIASTVSGAIIETWGHGDGSARIATVRMMSPSGAVATVQCDELSRPILLNAPNGGRIELIYSTATALVTIVSSDGQTRQTIEVSYDGTSDGSGPRVSSGACADCIRLARNNYVVCHLVLQLEKR